MSCRYKNECPSYSGWCEGPKQDFSKCTQFLITAYENVIRENVTLVKRLQHLLKSETVALYDEVDPRTREYRRDIKELDSGRRACTLLTIYIPDILMEMGNSDQLKEFLYGVVDDAIYNKQKEIQTYPRSNKNAL